MGGQASPQVIGRYALHGKIASGGMATVHFGRLTGAAGFARTVAVKRLHPHLADEPDLLSTMIDEARLAARIHHPNVVPTLDVVAADGELLVIMEYVRGESLSRLLRAETARGRRVPVPIASAIIVGALHGLHAAHEATSDHGTPLGIVHRDVSPQNILVDVDGVPRVIDFGVAKAAGRLQTTREGVVKGKMAYMAPEQLSAREVTRAVDVYGMGVVLWETLTGKRLFQAESDVALFGLVLAGANDPPSRHVPDLSPELDALTMKALAREPTERFASAREMAEALLRLVPPAFSTDVGAWVTEVARDAIAQRGAVLAEIESNSGMETLPSVDEGRGATAPLTSADSPSVVSQASSLSVVKPKSRAPGERGPGRARLAGALGVAMLLAVGIWAVALRGRAPSGTVSAGTGAPAESAPLPPASASAALPTPSASVVPVPPPVVASATTASGTTVRPAAATPRPHASPRPTSSIRFVKPD